ncbi:MAG: regulatory protein RecX [Gemmatimonadota bacterium]
MSDEVRDDPAALSEPMDEQRRALDAALSFLSYRPRTSQEVRRKLAERGYAEGTVEQTLGRLGQVGLVNDTAFVESYVRGRIAHRPMGVRRMADELYLKGIGRNESVPIIEQVFADERVDERALAAHAAEKRVSSLRNGRSDDRTVRRRLRDHLARRGFGVQIVGEAVDTWAPHHSERNS